MKTMKGIKAALLVALLAGTALPGRAQTRIMFYADTEDYTCDASNDGIRDFARTMTEEGVRANFNIVGYLAMRIQEFGRKDVIEALKPHVLGTQSLYHSLHPTPAEYGDDPIYERSYRKALMEESAAKAMVEAVFGEGRVRFAVHPGHSMSIGNIEAKVDIGVPLGVGGFVNCETGNLDMARPGPELDGLWYFNMYQAPYLTGTFHLEYLIPGASWYVPPERYGEIFDKLARYDLIGIGFHPHMQIKTKYWDGVNYRYGNQVKWREWNQVPNRKPEHTAAFYENLRAFVRALKADGRFRLTDFDEIERNVRPRVAITPAHLPVIRKCLQADFNCIRDPASWSVADVFQACVRFLRGAQKYQPGKVYGFLDHPRGVSSPVEVSAVGLRTAAERIDLLTFLPPEIEVEEKKIGPADFLFAALEVLTTGAERVLVTPREQLGSFKEIPSLEKFHLKGVWLHSKEFNDTYTTERFRLQLWTLRIEPIFGRK